MITKKEPTEQAAREIAPGETAAATRGSNDQTIERAEQAIDAGESLPNYFG